MLQTVAREETRAAKEIGQPLDLARLFRENYRRLYSYLCYRLNSPDDVEDIIGTVFEKAYARRDQFDPAKGVFSAWLFRIAQNELADYFRRNQRRSVWESGADLPLDLAAPGASPETRVMQQEQLGQLLRALEHLAERDQEIISLKFASKLSNREIGQIMDLKEKTVSVVLLRAVRRLRTQIETEIAL